MVAVVVVVVGCLDSLERAILSTLSTRRSTERSKHNSNITPKNGDSEKIHSYTLTYEPAHTDVIISGTGWRAVGRYST
jgi:hypothetical protein